MQVQLENIKNLRTHPLNAKIYGDTFDQELEESIAKKGILSPLLITKDHIIISGHRRYYAAIKLNIAEVPIIFSDIVGTLEIEETIIFANRQRTKTNEQKAREFIHLEEIEKEKAKIAKARKCRETNERASITYMPQADSNPVPATLPEPDLKNIKNLSNLTSGVREKNVESRDIAAKKLGIGYKTARKGAKVVAKIDELAAEGKVQEADYLRKALNNKSVNAAHKAIVIKEAKESIAAQVVGLPTLTNVEHENCSAWLTRQDQCDLLLTDPPYSTDLNEGVSIEMFARSWLPQALSKVKSTGRAYIFIGSYPSEVAAYLSVAPPTQILIWTYKNTLGPKPKDFYIRNLQFILYYRMKDAPELDCPLLTEQWSVQEINAPDGRQNNRYHTWQKPDEIAERFIRHSTKQGDVVFDPFCCTGTFPLAATRLGRIGKGCDISLENLKIAENRGCTIIQNGNKI